MLPIDVLIRSAVNDGAYFEVVDHNVVVHGASLIDEDVRQALKARRDELHLQLQSNNENTTPAGLLRSCAVSAVFIDDDTTARRMIKGLFNDLKDGFVAIDFETHAINTDSDTKAAKRSALNPLKANVRLIQIYGCGGSCLVMDMQHVRWSSLGALWDQRLVFHNAQFELSFLRHRNIYFAVAGGATTETGALGSIPGIGKCAEIANRFRIKPICSDTDARYV